VERRISGTVSSKPQRGIGLNRMLREAKLIKFQEEKKFCRLRPARRICGLSMSHISVFGKIPYRFYSNDENDEKSRQRNSFQDAS
jgi:hypothetical protein